MSDRRTGFTDDDDTICQVMMDRWADDDVEGKSVGASHVASFADMARAVRESDWVREQLERAWDEGHDEACHGTPVEQNPYRAATTYGEKS